MEQNIVVYENGANLRLQVKTDGETVWLSQEQMSVLFGRDQSVIARHISNIFKEGELERDSVYAKVARSRIRPHHILKFISPFP